MHSLFLVILNNTPRLPSEWNNIGMRIDSKILSNLRVTNYYFSNSFLELTKKGSKNSLESDSHEDEYEE